MASTSSGANTSNGGRSLFPKVEAMASTSSGASTSNGGRSLFPKVEGMASTSSGASTSNGGRSSLSDLMRALKERKNIWERGEEPQPGSPQFRELVGFFRDVSDINEMNLVGMDLGDIIVNAMGTAMMEVPFLSLTSLQLGGNYITEVGIHTVAEAIKLGHLPALESLGFFPPRTANERERFMRREEAQWIRNMIKDEGVKALADAFAAGHSSSLRFMTLEQNGLSQQGVGALANVIEAGHLRSLEILNLSYNDVGDRGITLLARAFVEAGNQLRVLDLETCHILTDGTRALTSALMSGRFSALTDLYLSNNNNSSWRALPEGQSLSPIDEALIELATVLQNGHLPKVQLLDLERNAGGRRAAEAFRNAVRNNESLVLTFKIDWPSFGPYESSVRKYIDRNRRIAQILVRLQGEEDVLATSGKIFLCGNAMEGKTTLRRSLQNNLPAILSMFSFFFREKRKRNEPRTRGIEVSHIVSNGIRLAIWDLAGQAEYHVLHSAFLPDMALADGPATTFVVVCNAKYPSEDMGNNHRGKDLLSYWMRFIASSSLRGQETGKRHVVVVLNCFDDNPCQYLDQWKRYLVEFKKLFADYLVIEESPYVVDARVAKKVRPLKQHLIDHTRQKLEIKKVPKICQFVQNSILAASAKKKDFPVVTWAGFAAMFQSSVSDPEKLKAAADYLHESGHLIHLRDGWEGRTNEGPYGPGGGLVVLDPDWFCRRVVGDLLLPDTMLRDGDARLSRRLQPDGSLALQDLKDYFRHLKFGEEQVPKIVAMLLRLGICYMAGTEKVLIPALISDEVLGGNQDPCRFWALSEMQQVQEQWVMGYCLKVQYTTTTLLPIAVFRRLQVELAQEPMYTATDSRYTCGKFNITFGTNGMAVLVEFSDKEADPNQENRVDILVRPLVGGDRGSETWRELQVQLAQLILEKFVDLAETWSPGVELKHLVVKPWCTTEGPLPMDQRNVELSVDNVKTRMLAGETVMAWKVGGELVKLIDLLSGREMRELESTIGQKCDQVDDLIDFLGLETEKPADDHGDHGPTHNGDVDPGLQLLKEHFDRGMRRLSTKMDDVRRAVESVREDLGKVLHRQKKVLKRLQALERFTRDEIRNSVPRFMYLTKSENPAGPWMNLKSMFIDRATLHFLCEAHYNDNSLHQVANQQGVEIRNLTELVSKVTPWLIWSLKVAFIVGKVASQALLPGLGQLITIFTQQGSNSEDYSRGTAVGYWVAAVLIGSSEAEKQLRGKSIDTSSIRNNRSTPSRPVEVEGGLKGVLRDMIGDIGDDKFLSKFKLRRAVMKSSGHVVWICDDCFHKYRHDGALESL